MEHLQIYVFFWNKIRNQHVKNHKNSGQLRNSLLSHLLISLTFFGCQNCPRRFKLVGQKIAEVIEHLRAFGSGLHLKKEGTEGILLLGV